MSSQSVRRNSTRGALRARCVIEGALDHGRETRSVEARGTIGTSALMSETFVTHGV